MAKVKYPQNMIVEGIEVSSERLPMFRKDFIDERERFRDIPGCGFRL